MSLSLTLATALGLGLAGTEPAPPRSTSPPTTGPRASPSSATPACPAPSSSPGARPSPGPRRTPSSCSATSSTSRSRPARRACPISPPGACSSRTSPTPSRASARRRCSSSRNHDKSWIEGEPPREKCVIAFAKPRKDLKIPAPYYAADFGAFVLVVLNSNALDDAQAAFVKSVTAAHPRARLATAAHHVLKTYHDKVGEDIIRPWLKAHDIRPALGSTATPTCYSSASTTASPPSPPAPARSRARSPCATPRTRRAAARASASAARLPASSCSTSTQAGHFSLTFSDATGKELYQWAEPKTPPVPTPPPTPASR